MQKHKDNDIAVLALKKKLEYCCQNIKHENVEIKKKAMIDSIDAMRRLEQFGIIASIDSATNQPIYEYK